MHASVLAYFSFSSLINLVLKMFCAVSGGPWLIKAKSCPKGQRSRLIDQVTFSGKEVLKRGKSESIEKQGNTG